MLHATRNGFFRQTYDISQADGPVTTLADLRRESCAFTLDGHRYQVTRERRKRFTLTGPRGHVATADQAAGRRWTIGTRDDQLELVRPSVWRSAWELHRGQHVLGTVRQSGMGKRSTAELPPDLPTPLRVFLFYLVIVQWRRAASAAAANSGG